MTCGCAQGTGPAYDFIASLSGGSGGSSTPSQSNSKPQTYNVTADVTDCLTNVGPGYHWDSTARKCVPDKLPQTHNVTADVTDCLTNIGPGYHWDSTTRKCVPDKLPQTYNVTADVTDCLTNIGPGYHWDSTTRKCVPDLPQSCSYYLPGENRILPGVMGVDGKCGPDGVEEGAACGGGYDDLRNGTGTWTGAIVNGQCVRDTPPFIKELFPVGSVIDYIDGGATSVALPGGGKCELTADDIVKLLMVKESWRDQEIVRWTSNAVHVTMRDGTELSVSQTDLDDLVKSYYSFWDLDAVTNDEEVISTDNVSFDSARWLAESPEGYKMSSYAFTAASTRMNGILGYGVMVDKPPVAGTTPLYYIAEQALRFINWSPNPEGRPGQGKAALFDKCGNQITLAEAETRMTGYTGGGGWNPFKGPEYGGTVEIVYKVDSYGGDPTVFNSDSGYLEKYPITDYGCFYGTMPKLTHPTARVPNHPDQFYCGDYY